MSGQAETAAKLLAKYGEPVSVTFSDYAEYDPVTGAADGTTTQTTVVSSGYPSAYSTTEIDGTVIEAGDVRLILALISPAPVMGCMVALGGKAYRIMAVRQVRLSGADIIFICQVRAN